MQPKRILIIDGQGGLLGSTLIKAIRSRYPGAELMAVGTNATAAAAMKKAGADKAAAGENPVIVACRKANIIIGPVGIVIADALLGEVTAPMAAAVGRADATRILIPVNRCENLVAGVKDLSTAALIDDVMEKLHTLMD